MTIEEAKANLEKLLLLYDDGMIDFSVIRESVSVAIKALEKQIPKKVHIEEHHPKYGHASFCPNCNRMDVGGWSYCPYCGQAIGLEESEG